MRKWIGICCILLGCLCLLLSAGLIVHNRRQESHAEETSRLVLQDLRAEIESPVRDEAPPLEEVTAEALPSEMTAVQTERGDCIGVLSVPALGLELPVLADWSYEKLQIAPCCYHGSCYDADFVIAAHNYRTHFGRLSELQPQDLVLFTDASDIVHCYEVVLLETLPPDATNEMITSGFDLSLYTCTVGGGSRVTVRCSLISRQQPA